MDECCRRGHGSNFWVGAVDSLLSMLKFDSLNLFQPRHGMASLPKIQCIYSNILALYQMQHPKFKVNFLATDEEQERLARLFPARLNQRNPFECGTYPSSIIIMHYGSSNQFNDYFEYFSIETFFRL